MISHANTEIIQHLSHPSLSVVEIATLLCIFQQPIMLESCLNLVNTLPVAGLSLSHQIVHISEKCCFVVFGDYYRLQHGGGE